VPPKGCGLKYSVARFMGKWYNILNEKTRRMDL